MTSLSKFNSLLLAKRLPALNGPQRWPISGQALRRSGTRQLDALRLVSTVSILVLDVLVADVVIEPVESWRTVSHRCRR